MIGDNSQIDIQKPHSKGCGFFFRGIETRTFR